MIVMVIVIDMTVMVIMIDMISCIMVTMISCTMSMVIMTIMVAITLRLVPLDDGLDDRQAAANAGIDAEDFHRSPSILRTSSAVARSSSRAMRAIASAAAASTPKS